MNTTTKDLEFQTLAVEQPQTCGAVKPVRSQLLITESPTATHINKRLKLCAKF